MQEDAGDVEGVKVIGLRDEAHAQRRPRLAVREGLEHRLGKGAGVPQLQTQANELVQEGGKGLQYINRKIRKSHNLLLVRTPRKNMTKSHREM